MCHTGKFAPHQLLDLHSEGYVGFARDYSRATKLGIALAAGETARSGKLACASGILLVSRFEED
jgi:hypothetical protein